MSSIFILKCVRDDALGLESQNFKYNEYTTLICLKVLNISKNANIPYKTAVLVKSTLLFRKR
jgi:hypothetical protein